MLAVARRLGVGATHRHDNDRSYFFDRQAPILGLWKESRVEGQESRATRKRNSLLAPSPRSLSKIHPAAVLRIDPSLLRRDAGRRTQLLVQGIRR